MRTTTSRLTSKSQVTVPAWVRNALDLKPSMELVWVELRPGEISVLARPLKKNSNSGESLCGILEDKGPASLVDSLLEDRKKDLEYEKRGLDPSL